MVQMYNWFVNEVVVWFDSLSYTKEKYHNFSYHFSCTFTKEKDNNFCFYFSCNFTKEKDKNFLIILTVALQRKKDNSFCYHFSCSFTKEKDNNFCYHFTCKGISINYVINGYPILWGGGVNSHYRVINLCGHKLRGEGVIRH